MTLDFIHTEEQKARSVVSDAKTFSWFHATRVKNWYSKLSKIDGMAHIGEYEASKDIMCSGVEKLVESGSSRKLSQVKYYLWELRFTDEAEFFPTLEADVEDESVDCYVEDVSTLYVNRWESPGSISVYTPVRSLTPVGMKVVTGSEIAKMDSIYFHDVTLPSGEDANLFG
jgi:hypothetical protein